MSSSPTSARRVAIVAGVRTPFAPANGSLATLSALDLAVTAVSELLERAPVAPEEVERLVLGRALPVAGAANPARDAVLLAGLPPRIDACTVSASCASGHRAAIDLMEAIESGAVECGIAAGADSASDPTVNVSRSLADALRQAGDARNVGGRLRAFRRVKPRDLMPVPPPSTTEDVERPRPGREAERLARRHGIDRAAQDAFAHRSHERAAGARARGDLEGERIPIYVPPDYRAVVEDANVRRSPRLTHFSRLAPVVDPRWGTITSGNSAPPSDGAAALLLASEEWVRAHGVEVLGFVRGHALAASDPVEDAWMGAAVAGPRALERAGCTLADLELVDVHEAFAAQVLAVARGLGDLEPERLNPCGGSIAVGHAFAATGPRQLLRSAHELRRRGGGLALVAVGTGGGLGAGLVLEVA